MVDTHSHARTHTHLRYLSTSAMERYKTNKIIIFTIVTVTNQTDQPPATRSHIVDVCSVMCRV